MRQFKQLGWISQALLGLVLLSAMSQSNAMSVRERYLQEHPAAKAENSPEKASVSHKESSHHKKHHVSEKHVVKTSEHHAKKPVAQKHMHHSAMKEHAKVEQAKVEHVKHHASKHSIKKEEVESKAKDHANRVTIPKLAPTKFDSQQARAAEEALKHQPVQKEDQAKPAPTKHHHAAAHHEAKKSAVKHHAVKSAHAHHHKRHHAE